MPFSLLFKSLHLAGIWILLLPSMFKQQSLKQVLFQSLNHFDNFRNFYNIWQTLSRTLEKNLKTYFVLPLYFVYLWFSIINQMAHPCFCDWSDADHLIIARSNADKNFFNILKDTITRILCINHWNCIRSRYNNL